MKHSSHIFIIIILTLIIIINIQTTFSLHINNSNNNKNITLYGDSKFTTNTTTNTTSITLTNQEPSSFGGAFYNVPVHFLDSITKAPVSFFTLFSFTITPVSDPGEGFSFLITSNVGSFNQENGHLGLPELSLSALDAFFAVEFDTKVDPFVNDINGNHVGVDVDSYSSLFSADGFSSRVNFSSGDRVYAWIEYKNFDKLINVWVSYSSDMPKDPSISAHIDLSNHMKEFMYVGFVASNGEFSVSHVLYTWRFKTFESDIFPLEMAPVKSTEGVEGCLICNPEVSTKSDKNGGLLDTKGGRTWLAIGICFTLAVVGIVLFFSAPYIVTLLRMTAKRVNQKDLTLISVFKSKIGLVHLSLSDVRYATNTFSKSRIIGQGASSTVYKGIFGGDLIVAVKRFNQASRVDIHMPFTTEFSAMVPCLRHKNLVQLLGFCRENNELVLVYEFLPNGNLDHHLFKNPGCGSFLLLTWEQRMNIILGIASGLTYLHEECNRQIIHRDVKASNVMLDSDFTPKLGDFGLVEVYDRGSSSSNSSKITLPAGTMGYFAPEYVYHGIPTVKTDVYSFGVVILETVSGKRAFLEDCGPLHVDWALLEGCGRLIVDWAWALWEKRRVTELIDGRLHGEYDQKDMERMIKVGLWCVHPDSEKRPTAKEVGMMLQRKLRIPALPAKRPILELQEVVLDVLVDDKMDSPWSTPKTHFGND